VVGATGYAVNIAAFALVLALGARHLVAAAAAFGVAVAGNFWWNRRWTFRAGGGAPALQAARFLTVSLAAFLFAAAILELLAGSAGIPVLAAQAASVAAATPLGFLGNRSWSFGDAAPSHAATAAAAEGTERPATWLVVPTYNEAENIEPFVDAVLEKLPASSQVLVVDDSSPDGTGEIADRLAAEHESVSVLHRPRKEGRGPALIAGFRRALEGGAELILEMDSDFSHQPAYLPRLLDASEWADLVIGSRYVPGGGVSDWGAVRRAISRGGNVYARLVLGAGVNDLTGGFKCFRREVLEAIDLDAVQSKGYAFQVELTYRAIQQGFRVVEVPIVFRDRREGSSKMSRGIVAEAVWRVPLLRFNGLRSGRR
jgi:dolichol-phosphate mannosyltransferase